VPCLTVKTYTSCATPVLYRDKFPSRWNYGTFLHILGTFHEILDSCDLLIAADLKINFSVLKWLVM
jgi:hypothetical protein